MSYLPRIVDTSLKRLIADLPALALDGAKGVGKTVAASRLAHTVIPLDDEEQFELLHSDPTRITRLTPPVLLDEWQLYPRLWDRVRRAVDAGSPPGSFLLTGSASPSEAPTHTGAGRIVRVRMRPLSVAERALTPPTVSLAQLLTGEKAHLDGESSLSLEDYANEIVASGFPGIRAVPIRSREDVLDSYIANIIEREFTQADHVVRQPGALRAWLAAYAAATATTAAYSTILNAATYGESDKPAKTTTIAYRETLRRMWLLDEVPAYVGRQPHLTALGKSPKHHLADPALAARILGVSADSLLNHPNGEASVTVRRGILLGALFEGLVTLSLQVYSEANRARVSHLRTSSGAHEVDLIVERNDGRIVAFEVKLAPTVSNEDVRHLIWLKEILGNDLLDAGVITTGKTAYRRPDGIAVIPAALLGM